MPTTYLISDTHFGHAGVCRFTRADGSKLRPWTSPDEMDEALVTNWNSVVKPNDTVYHLGDVVINRRCLPTLGRLNGNLKLIKGNHDKFRLEEYTPYFKDILGSHEFEGMILTHIPIHPNQLDRFGANVHGHMHAHHVAHEQRVGGGINIVPDPRYLCVSVEQTNYFPISLEEVRDRLRGQSCPSH